MLMEFLPGGDLMSMLIKYQTFSEDITEFYMAELVRLLRPSDRSCHHGFCRYQPFTMDRLSEAQINDLILLLARSLMMIITLRSWGFLFKLGRR
ncbi:hypothetical protein EV127DRAFT_435404 [Xylaria flabelliformis]|nr:hypothetical protein EV127DRAFT_435404 [Xylaria flabelliformis]